MGVLPVEHLSYENLRRVSDIFLKKYHPDGSIPVPVEDIIDLKLKVDIVPTPGLRRSFDVDAFITSDLTTVYVDDSIYESNPNRYRFSLAHEIAHALLHDDIYKKLKFSNIAEWKRAVTSIPEKDYGWIEWQAYALAGLILVPSEALEEQFKRATSRLSKVGLSVRKATEAARHMLAGNLAQDFQVSTRVIEKRLEYDKLWRQAEG